MGVVEEPIADGVGQGRVRHVVGPPLRRQLAGDDGRAGAGAVLEDLEDVAALGVLQGAEGPIVQHQHVDAGAGRGSGRRSRRLSFDAAARLRAEDEPAFRTGYERGRARRTSEGA
jgi:hypothetical protein